MAGFTVQVDGMTYDNGEGASGFPVQDVVLVQPESCYVLGFSEAEGQSWTVNILAAVSLPVYLSITCH